MEQEVATVGLDLGMNVIQVHAIAADGAVLIRRNAKRWSNSIASIQFSRQQPLPSRAPLSEVPFERRSGLFQVVAVFLE